jgi:NAD(P)-dependent dehydrogenase (short-subunit alcohol dehydrogenase family)
LRNLGKAALIAANVRRGLRMKDLEGKVAVITGGASGIGLATARTLAHNGVKLVLADIEEKTLATAVSKLRAEGAQAIGLTTDVGDKAGVDRLADQAWSHFGAAHIVFNNAGVAVFGPIEAMTHADWQWTLQVNLWGPIHGIEAFVPRMIAQKEGGHMLFTASFAGLVGNRNLGPYSVSKAAVVSLAECLAKDVKQHGIGVSVLCPMRVTTNIEESHRNRPAELGGPQIRQAYTQSDADALEGRILPADQVGDLVVAAIRRNDLFILTHKESEAFVGRRSDRIRAAAAHAL